jgi:phage gpG-like protein
MSFDFVRYTRELADRVGWLTGITARKAARRNVRVDTGTLRNSIQLDKVAEDRHEVSANTEYAAAQEWGRPDLPNYGFTPYMRPAAKEAVDEIRTNAEEAARMAARKAK